MAQKIPKAKNAKNAKTAKNGPRARDSWGCCLGAVLGMVLIIALLAGGVCLLIEFGPGCDAKCKAAPSVPIEGGGG